MTPTPQDDQFFIDAEFYEDEIVLAPLADDDVIIYEEGTQL